MILKRNFNPVRVVGYVRSELLWAVFASSAVYVLHSQNITTVGVPFSVAAILGSALAIFIAFRNNSAYGRWWEARTIWGGVVHSARVFARLIITFADSHSHQQGYRQERAEAFKREMVYAVIAWAHSLRLHLRLQQDWHVLEPLLSDRDYRAVLKSLNKPLYLQLLMGRKIYSAMADGTLGGFDSFQMEAQMLALANCQAGCERIKNTPLLRQYDFFTRVFLYVFIGLLPLALAGDFARMNADVLMPIISVVVQRLPLWIL